MALRDRIADYKRFEGLRLEAYQDTGGVWTIGYGHTPAKPGQTCAQATADLFLLTDDGHAIEDLDDDAATKDWWRTLDDARQDALIELSFNMGERTLDEFVHFLAALKEGHPIAAAAALKDSAWYREVNGDGRGDFVCDLVNHGARP